MSKGIDTSDKKGNIARAAQDLAAAQAALAAANTQADKMKALRYIALATERKRQATLAANG